MTIGEKFDHHHKQSLQSLPKPQNLQKMILIASELSKGLPQSRIDLYEVDDKVYFGEITLTSMCGRMKYFTPSYLNVLGEECMKAARKLKIKQ